MSPHIEARVRPASLLKLGGNILTAALSDCAAAPGVLDEVRKNYASNLWWPTEVMDWRTRMLVAGWSTRVSYAHLHHYQAVVANVNRMTWDALVRADDTTVLRLVKPLGLGTSRLAYLRSLVEYLATRAVEGYLDGANDSLIEDYALHVSGAGYKVAQCAVLYAKGYHCGIIPIDSGMVEMLEPILPERAPAGAYAHEAIRQWIEQLVASRAEEIRAIAASAGFVVPEGRSPTWWTHLVLIYYKRLYWNRSRPTGPFRRRHRPEDAPAAAESGGYPDFPGVVIEGVDGTGKTYFAELLRSAGYKYVHCPHRAGEGVFQRYERLIRGCEPPIVLDRSFISEYVYGRVVRGESRLSVEECEHLLNLMAARGFVVFHLEESEEILAERREAAEDRDHRSSLLREYRRFFRSVQSAAPVYSVRPSQLAPGYMLRFLGRRSEDPS